MLRWSHVVCTYLVALMLVVFPSASWAQGGPVEDASAPSAVAPAATATATATASSEPAPRPARGPSVRERGGRRSRGASTASGAFFVIIIVGALGWYVVKRLRR